MHATLLTDVGLLVDGTVVRRLEEEFPPPQMVPKQRSPSTVSDFATLGNPRSSRGSRSLLLTDIPTGSYPFFPPEDTDVFSAIRVEELHCLPYECEAIGKKIPQTNFEFMDVLPWGFRSPSTVFSTVGLHTNKGLVMGVGPAGYIRIRPYTLCRSKEEVALYGNEPFSLCQVRNPKATSSGVKRSPHPLRLPLKPNGDLEEAALLFFEEQSFSSEVVERRRVFFHIAQFLKDREVKSRQVGGDLLTPNSSAPALTASVTHYPMDELLGQSEDNGIPGAYSSHSEVENPLALLFVSDEDVSEECRASQDRLLEQSTNELELWDLADLQLAPALALHPPISPCKVGSRVMARRFGGGIEIATVVAAQYDCSYSLQYDSDGYMDVGVLHNDIHLLSEKNAEPCTVRDRVVVTLQMQVPAIIVEAMGNENYRVVLVNDKTGDAFPVQLQHVALITPLLKEGLYSNPQHVQWFKELDPHCTGSVTWRVVRQLIRETVEVCGLALSEKRLRQIQSTVSSKGQAAVRHQFVHIEDDMPLIFVEFEYALLAAQNMVD